MNCPTCGAQNDADARFCAECGAPLEDQTVEAAKAGEVFDESEQDKTILSTPGDLAAEEAKTLSVDQAQVAAAVEEEEETPTAGQSEPSTPPSEPSPADPTDAGQVGGGVASGDGGGRDNRMMIIIGVVVLVLLLCCCCSLVIGGALGSEDILREFTALPVYLSFV